MKIPWQLHLIALIVVVSTLGTETFYLFRGSQAPIPDVLIGRILGTLDAALVGVLGYYFTASITQNRASAQRASDSQQPSKGPPT